MPRDRLERADTDLARTHPIFIMGYLHSGTTLLQQILGNNDSVYIGGGETRFFSHLPLIREKYKNLEEDALLRAYLEYLVALINTGYAALNYHGRGDDLPGLLAEKGVTQEDMSTLFAEARHSRDHALLFGLTYDYLARRAGKVRWLDKLPGHMSQLPQILSTIPEALAIQLVRDPRDVLASKKRRAAKGGNYDPLWDTLGWREAARAGDLMHQMFSQQLYTVRYEDLVSEPQAETERICEFLNLDFDPGMLAVGWINATAVDSKQKRSGIGGAAIGKWQEQLAPADILLIQNVAAKEMQEHSYELLPISARQYTLLPLLMLRSSGEFFTRLYKRWRLGGPELVMNVLDSYFQRLKTPRNERTAVRK